MSRNRTKLEAVLISRFGLDPELAEVDDIIKEVDDLAARSEGRTRSARLLLAYRLVNSIRMELNTKTKECQCCGIKKMEHYGDAKADVVLRGIQDKMLTLSGRIDDLNKEKQERKR